MRNELIDDETAYCMINNVTDLIIMNDISHISFNSLFLCVLFLF